MRLRPVLVVATVLALLAGVVVVLGYATRSRWTEPQPVKEQHDELSAFYTQTLNWTDCDDAHCTWVTVPIDYEAPTGDTTRLRVKVFAATDADATHSLFVNPGGPGGSAIDYAATMAGSLPDDVRARYDIVGVDPRGVGQSSPLTCLSARAFDRFTRVDPDPDDAAEVAELRDSVEQLGRACEQNSGALAAHVSTEEAARDMDVVRALLGRHKLDWFGASYGTQLGATYAQLFPGKVGRMVLDGAVDPSLGPVEAGLGQTTGFQRAVTAYAKDCAKSSDCPLGADVDTGLSKISALLDQLDVTPMRTSLGRTLTEGQAFYGIAVTLYDTSGWPLLTEALRQAMDGDGTALLILSDAYFERRQDGSYASSLGQVIYAVNCLDGAERPTQDQVEALIPRFEKASPVFGTMMAWGVLSCTDWPIRATHPQPAITASGAPPIVVLGTTRDPATPYEWAKALADQLTSGVLVTRQGDGHTAYASGNRCIRDAVDAYLVDGTVPRDGLVCD